MLPCIMERVGKCRRMQRQNARCAHQKFARAVQIRVEERLRSDAAIEQFESLLARIFRGPFADRHEHLPRGVRVRLAFEPIRAHILRAFKVLAIWPVRWQISL